MAGKTYFGFRTVEEGEKAGLVRGVFDSVASRYDLMNDLMSAGLHRLWKNELVAMVSPKDGMRMLDVAGGTGDIAFRLKEKADCHVTICDINYQMLREGKNRSYDLNKISKVNWLCGDAQSLPLPDNSFDVYTIAFGIRNVTHIDKALSEAWRVLRPGGEFFCLEFSHLPNNFLQKLYDAYSFTAIPQIGKMVTGDRASYQYLVESIRKFPKQEEFSEMIKTAGFSNAYYKNLSQGVVAIHSGHKN